MRICDVARLLDIRELDINNVYKSILSSDQYVWVDNQGRGMDYESLGWEVAINYEGIIKLVQHLGLQKNDVIENLYSTYMEEAYNSGKITRETYLQHVSSKR